MQGRSLPLVLGQLLHVLLLGPLLGCDGHLLLLLLQWGGCSREAPPMARGIAGSRREGTAAAVACTAAAAAPPVGFGPPWATGAARLAAWVWQPPQCALSCSMPPPMPSPSCHPQGAWSTPRWVSGPPAGDWGPWGALWAWPGSLGGAVGPPAPPPSLLAPAGGNCGWRPASVPSGRCRVSSSPGQGCSSWGRRFQAEVGMPVAGLSAAGWGRDGGTRGWYEAGVGMPVPGSGSIQ